jgi:HlyD family secretion protein
MRWRRTIGLLSVALLVAGGLAWGFWPRPVPVDGARVERGPLTVTVEEEGRTRVKDRYVVSAPVAGYLRRVELEVGDPVEQGQVLASLDPMPSEVLDPRRRAQAEAQVASAKAALGGAEEQVAAARAQAEYARAEYARKLKLRRDKSVSQDAVELAASVARQNDANLRSADFSVEVARFELEAAQTALKFSATTGQAPDEAIALNAPVAGRVLKRYRESAGVVAAAEALVEVGDPTALEVEVDVLSADAIRIRPGTRVRFERWGGEGLLEGVVHTVEPVCFTKISALGVEEQRVWVIADITSPRERWSELGDAYRVEASFIIWHADDVLRIPTSALFRHGDAWAVFVIDGGKAHRRVVETGQRSGLVAQIVKGLSAGDVVITHPDDRIADGVRVAPRGTD